MVVFFCDCFYCEFSLKAIFEISIEAFSFFLIEFFGIKLWIVFTHQYQICYVCKDFFVCLLTSLMNFEHNSGEL